MSYVAKNPKFSRVGNTSAYVASFYGIDGTNSLGIKVAIANATLNRNIYEGYGNLVDLVFYVGGDGLLYCSSIKGVATNSNAPAGSVGEMMTASRLRSAATSLTTATAANITAAALTLTAGDWDVWGAIGFEPAATTVMTLAAASISTTTATLSGTDTAAVSDAAGQVRIANQYPAGYVPTAQVGLVLPMTRVSLAATTAYYLVGRADFSVSTLTAFGSINARRVR